MGIYAQTSTITGIDSWRGEGRGLFSWYRNSNSHNPGNSKILLSGSTTLISATIIDDGSGNSTNERSRNVLNKPLEVIYTMGEAQESIFLKNKGQSTINTKETERD